MASLAQNPRARGVSVMPDFTIEHRRLPPTRGELSRERHAERQNATPPKPKRRHSRLIGLAPRGTVVTNLTVGGSRCRTEARADVETEADYAADARAEKLVPEVVYVPPERVEQQVTPAREAGP